jgi:hypothetical protein
MRWAADADPAVANASVAKTDTRVIIRVIGFLNTMASSCV